jgi:hypothetical protein
MTTTARPDHTTTSTTTNAATTTLGRRRIRPRLALAAVLAVVAGAVMVGVASRPASAAFGPNLIVNGGFEVPATPSGTAPPPFGSCSDLVSSDFLGTPWPSYEGCWSYLTLFGTDSTHVDRQVHKAGKQSALLEITATGRSCLSQPVQSGAGTYRLTVAATGNLPQPVSARMAALAGGATLGADVWYFGPVTHQAGAPVWVNYTFDFTAPATTEHVLVQFCVDNFQSGGSASVRLDVVTLKKML